MATNWNIPDAFATLTAYAIGDTATFNGVVYEATVAIPDTNTTDPRVDGGVNWKVSYVVNIEDAYGLWNAIAIAFNRPNDDIINGSIWMFIQQSNYALNRIIRSPAMRVTRQFILDEDGRFPPPTDLLQVDALRAFTDQGTQFTLAGRGNIEILAAVNRSDLIDQQESIRRNGALFTDGSSLGPLYWYDRDFFYVTDGIYADQTVMEMTYYAAEAALGEIVGELNSDFEPINSDGETLEEWIEAGNDADDFVQNMILVTTNVFTAQFPHLIKLGALVAAEDYLRDPEQSVKWKAEYDRALTETIDEINRFDSNRPYNVELYNEYS